MKHYGIPGKFIWIIKNSYHRMTCKVLHVGKLSESFTVTVLVSTCFWLAHEGNNKRTAKWYPVEHRGAPQLFRVANDISLVSSNNQQVQDKTAQLTANSIKLGLHLKCEQTKVMKVNCTNRQIIVRDTILNEVTSFVYPGSIISTDRGSDEDVKVGINKARVTFNIFIYMYI